MGGLPVEVSRFSHSSRLDTFERRRNEHRRLQQTKRINGKFMQLLGDQYPNWVIQKVAAVPRAQAFVN